MNLYVLNVLENCHAILLVATHHMIKLILVIGRKYFLSTLHKAITEFLKLNF